MGERMVSCQTCGMLLPAVRPVFHPHVYCMVYKAGQRDPEKYMRATMPLLREHFPAPSPERERGETPPPSDPLDPTDGWGYA